MEPSVEFLKPTGMDRPLGQFAVDLGFGVTRADGTPADRVAEYCGVMG